LQCNAKPAAMQSSEDIELLSQITSGNKKAFEKCFNKHWHVLFTFADKMLKSNDDAKDIVQLVFISLWGRREQLQITGSLQNYLLQAVRFQSLKRLKEIMDSPENLERVQENYLPVLNDIWDKLNETDVFKEIEEQLESLPSKTREMFLLSRRHHLSIAEIAVRMGLSEKTVRNQLHIAIKTLRHNIAIILIFADLVVC
jgi:RNA polymerase sigma-70 factor (ECF subfamily)